MRDYILAVDASSSMLVRLPDGRSRWTTVLKAASRLAAGVEDLDPDGLDVYTFATRVKKLGNATAQGISDLFAKQAPFGSTDLAGLLNLVLRPWRPESPATLLIITDGKPDDEEAAIRELIIATQKMSAGNQLAVSFVQIGDDPEATKFLHFLEDELVRLGAKFDVIDIVTVDSFGDRTLEEVLLEAIEKEWAKN
ncbi:MAG: hypothetical protein ACFCBU_11340 [Cyanophyceae cyanobacterium]